MKTATNFGEATVLNEQNDAMKEELTMINNLGTHIETQRQKYN